MARFQGQSEDFLLGRVHHRHYRSCIGEQAMTTQPETHIQRAIQKEMKKRGAFVFKVHGSETMMAGLPDLISCYRGYFLGIEVKTETGKVSPRQRFVMRNIMGAQGVVIVARNVADVSNALDRIDRIIENYEVVTDALSVGFMNDRVWRR